MPRFRPAAPLLLSLTSALAGSALAQASTSPPGQQAATSQPHFETSPVLLLNGKVEVQASPSLRFLNAADAKTLLIKEGNPPDAVSDIEGLLLPQTASGQDSWFVVLTENTDGHVSDADAASINYSQLLSQMQASVRENNKARTDAGYDAVNLLGWAETPSYDPLRHSMVWAKDVVFGSAAASSSHHTLNYAVRVLGRQDVLELNAVGSSEQLAQIKAGMAAVLPAVSFSTGNRYQDFQQGSDKLAAYGLAGLVAGGVVAQKVGLLGVLLLFLKKGWIVVLGGLALLRRVLGSVRRTRAAQQAPSATQAPAAPIQHPDLPRLSLEKRASTDGARAANGPAGRHG